VSILDNPPILVGDLVIALAYSLVCPPSAPSSNTSKSLIQNLKSTILCVQATISAVCYCLLKCIHQKEKVCQRLIILLVWICMIMAYVDMVPKLNKAANPNLKSGNQASRSEWKWMAVQFPMHNHQWMMISFQYLSWFLQCLWLWYSLIPHGISVDLDFRNTSVIKI
jgi:hypothetical protein